MDENNFPSFKNQFLIAMPHMDDPNFAHTITYICEHNEDGAMGIIVNRPLEIDEQELFEHLNIDVLKHYGLEEPVFSGGPVQTERGFVLHNERGDWRSTVQLDEDLYLTTSRDILDDIAQGLGPDHYLIALGYAGWGAGQLDNELSQNAWLTIPADDSLIFDIPIEQRWQTAAQSLGFDISLLSSNAGHA